MSKTKNEKHRNCITHHYACDCREEKFKQLEAENKRLADQLDQQKFNNKHNLSIDQEVTDKLNDLALENKRLADQHHVMIQSYNSLCDDLQRGEHVEISWVKDAIDSAARDTMVNAFNQKVSRLEKENKRLADQVVIMNQNEKAILDNNKTLLDTRFENFERISQLESALRKAKEKLDIYRENSDGKYQGGTEYTDLIRIINEALANKKSEGE